MTRTIHLTDQEAIDIAKLYARITAGGTDGLEAESEVVTFFGEKLATESVIPELGNLVLHSYSKTRGYVMDVRTNEAGYCYLVEWSTSGRNMLQRGWYKADVLEVV